MAGARRSREQELYRRHAWGEAVESCRVVNAGSPRAGEGERLECVVGRCSARACVVRCPMFHMERRKNKEKGAVFIGFPRAYHPKNF